jgi:site-specific recombinase XerD
MNIEKWTNRFIIDISQKYNSDSTIRNYSRNIFNFLTHFNNYREPKEIPTQLIKEYLLCFKTLNTRKQNLCALRKFYEYTLGMPKKVTKIPYPKKEKKLPKVIDSKYINNVINNIENLKHKAIIMLGI